MWLPNFREMIVFMPPEMIWVLPIKFYNKFIFIKHQRPPMLFKTKKLLNSYFVLQVLIIYVILKMSTIMAIEMGTKNREVSSAVLLSGAEAELVKKDTIDDEEYIEEDSTEDSQEDIKSNKTAKGRYVGASCDFTCHATLLHVYCDPITSTCGCEKSYPVVIGLKKGCAKPKKLGDQCFYHQTCLHSDANSLCIQTGHNAVCECAAGYHSVSYQKPTKRIFCTQDLSIITSDLPTLLGVTTGIFVLAGLICMVLHLFSKTKYPRTRNLGDTHFGPPVLFNSDTGIPLTIQSARPSSRSSGSIGSYGGSTHTRRTSGTHKGVVVSTSRQGSRRPSLTSVHSTSSSVRSYSSKRFERELQDKTERQEMKKEMKKELCRLQEQQQLQKLRPNIVITNIPYTVTKQIIPSPLTPNSTEFLLDSELASVDENQEYSHSRYTYDSFNNEPSSSADLFK